MTAIAALYGQWQSLRDGVVGYTLVLRIHQWSRKYITGRSRCSYASRRPLRGNAMTFEQICTG